METNRFANMPVPPYLVDKPAHKPDPMEIAFSKAYDVLAGGSNAVSNEYRSGVTDAIKVIRMAYALVPFSLTQEGQPK